MKTKEPKERTLATCVRLPESKFIAFQKYCVQYGHQQKWVIQKALELYFLGIERGEIKP